MCRYRVETAYWGGIFVDGQLASMFIRTYTRRRLVELLLDVSVKLRVGRSLKILDIVELHRKNDLFERREVGAKNSMFYRPHIP